MDVYDIMNNNWVSADAIGCIIHIIQKTTPTNIPWIFINPYAISTMHHVPFGDLKESHPYLFNKQFEKSKLLIVPLVGDNHWLLLVVDLEKKTWTMYNSLARSTRQNRYLNFHRMFLAWLKRFLNWRSESRDWDCVQVVWAEGIPKQDNGHDCGLFVVRYVHYIVADDPMKFDKCDIKKDRAIIAYKLLMDTDNKEKFDPKKDYTKKN